MPTVDVENGAFSGHGNFIFNLIALVAAGVLGKKLSSNI